jgi:hypothetical protein
MKISDKLRKIFKESATLYYLQSEKNANLVSLPLKILRFFTRYRSAGVLVQTVA